MKNLKCFHNEHVHVYSEHAGGKKQHCDTTPSTTTGVFLREAIIFFKLNCQDSSSFLTCLKKLKHRSIHNLGLDRIYMNAAAYTEETCFLKIRFN